MIERLVRVIDLSYFWTFIRTMSPPSNSGAEYPSQSACNACTRHSRSQRQPHKFLHLFSEPVSGLDISFDQRRCISISLGW